MKSLPKSQTQQSNLKGFDLPKALVLVEQVELVLTGVIQLLSALVGLEIFGPTSDLCECGEEAQTMDHIVQRCPIHSYPGTIEDIYNLTQHAANWLRKLNVDL
jgi:hypothetical protein